MKLVCRECDWRGTDGEILRAPNPFHPEWGIAGCPSCLLVDPFDEACEVLDCWARTTCGTPINEGRGYIRTCSKHRPK